MLPKQIVFSFFHRKTEMQALELEYVPHLSMWTSVSYYFLGVCGQPSPVAGRTCSFTAASQTVISLRIHLRLLLVPLICNLRHHMSVCM